jgi:hypothetical protein
MPFTLIEGTFHVTGYSPDGDSLRFKPNNLELLKALPGGRIDANARGHVQLRIEAIDALETHYTPQGGSSTFHQPIEFARDAVDALMAFVEIRNIRWTADRRTVASADDGTPGYILSREIEKYGRPVSFLFSGEAPEPDGASVMLTPDGLRDSYNVAALAAGLAYPTYYTGLFADLRQTLTHIAAVARKGRKGIHAIDATHAGFKAQTIADITDELVIMPKLFRRLSEYMSRTGSAIGFKQALSEAKEPVLDLRTSNFTHFDTFVAQRRGSHRIALTRLPEELVFGPMKDRAGNPFSRVLLERASVAMDVGTERLLG